MVLGTPAGAARPGDALGVEPVRDLARRPAGGVFGEDAVDHRRLLRVDRPTTADQLAVVSGLMHHPIAVGVAAARLAVLDPAPKTSPRLVGKVLDVERAHGALEPDMQFGDVAFRERHHAHAGEGQPLVDAGDLFLVARDSVERFREHDIEALPLPVFHQGLSTGTEQARSRDRTVAIALGDAPALALGPLPA